MLNPDERMVRGLSIAVIVLSAVALAGCLLLFFVLGVGSAMLADPNASFIVAHNDPEFMEALAYHGDTEAALVFTMLGLGLAALGVAWLAIGHIVVLVAGIIGLRSCTRPQTRTTAFGWSIAGAILSLLCGNLITMGLLIGSAVYLNKLRAPQQPMPPYQPPMPPAQPMQP